MLLVKIKSNSGRFYVFDAISNNIYELSNETDFNNITTNDLGYDYPAVRKDPLNYQNPREHILNNAKTLIIEITEDCNLRCKYCVFDENNNLERNHNTNSIELDTALKHVKNFFERTNKAESYIVFYGGEPLLMFDKIKKIVEYANSLSSNFKYSFTTNGIGLVNGHQKMIDFFIKHNFLITVSIDGDQETHDRNRITKTGMGSHSIIMNNLKRIKEYDLNFFNSNIIVNSVIPDVTSINKINTFFDSFDIQKSQIRFSPVIQNQVRMADNIDASIMQTISAKSLKSSIKTKSPVIFTPIEHNYIDSIMRKIHYRELDDNAKNGKKLCTPFSNRTYVRTNGDIQFCERIGNYKKVSDYEYILQTSEEIISEFKEFKEKDCGSCFAYNFCEMCPASFILNGKYNKELSDTKCSILRNSIKHGIEQYINKSELGEDPICY